jgi:hypothetical protein
MIASVVMFMKDGTHKLQTLDIGILFNLENGDCADIAKIYVAKNPTDAKHAIEQWGNRKGARA